jgi:hypothetical protein
MIMTYNIAEIPPRYVTRPFLECARARARARACTSLTGEKLKGRTRRRSDVREVVRRTPKV